MIDARQNGTYAMVAMDQRESLRTMFRDHGHDDGGRARRAFKTAVARELAPHASGFLIEPELRRRRSRRSSRAG